jgi:primase-polymerase (primpol)-like protein
MTELMDLAPELTELHRELFPPKPSLHDGNGNSHHVTRPIGLNDAELIERAVHAKNGAKFERLWKGDIADYPTHSHADMAFCCRLAYWTGNDAGRIDALFRQSGLYREKWEREDYRERTIARAIEQTSDTYDPGRAHSGGERNYRVNGAR